MEKILELNGVGAQSLARSQATVEATLQATTDAILVIGNNRQVSDCNRRFIQMWSIPADILASRDAHRLLQWVARSFSDPAAFCEQVCRINAHDAPTTDILRLADGRVIERRSHPQVVAEATTGRVWSFVDVSDRLRIDRTMRQEGDLLTWLNRTGPASGSSLEPQAVAEAATRAAVAFSSARFGWFIPHPALDDPELCAAFFGLDGHPTWQAIIQPGKHAALARATRDWQVAFRCDDLDLDENCLRLFAGDSARLRLPGVRSLLVVPVMPPSGQALGALALEHDTASGFPERVERLVGALASHTAVAIDNARLHTQIRNESNERALLSNLQKQSAQRLQHLTRRLMQAEEEERKRLGRELHDQVGANLSALGMGLELLRKQLPQDRDGAIDRRLADLQDTLIDTMGHVRAVLADLRPTALYELGLLPALRHQSDVLTLRSGIRFEVGGSEPAPRLPPDCEIAFYRVAQEAWANAMKHSGARCVTSTLSQQGGRVTMSVDDDGCGFEPADMLAGSARLGLTTMRERAEAIGATLEVGACPGSGVVVQMSLAHKRPGGRPR